MARNPSVQKTVRVELTPEEKAEVFRRANKGIHDVEFVSQLCEAHGYSHYECILYWQSGPNGQDAFFMCEPRAEPE